MIFRVCGLKGQPPSVLLAPERKQQRLLINSSSGWSRQPAESLEYCCHFHYPDDSLKGAFAAIRLSSINSEAAAAAASSSFIL